MSVVRLMAILASLLVLHGTARAGDDYWQGVAKTVSTAVEQVIAKYRAGDDKGARTALTEAYFGAFEDSKMEAAIRREIGKERAVEIEGMFGDLRSAIKAGDRAGVDRVATALHRALAEDGRALDAAKVPPDVYAVNQ